MSGKMAEVDAVAQRNEQLELAVCCSCDSDQQIAMPRRLSRCASYPSSLSLWCWLYSGLRWPPVDLSRDVSLAQLPAAST